MLLPCLIFIIYFERETGTILNPNSNSSFYPENAGRGCRSRRLNAARVIVEVKIPGIPTSHRRYDPFNSQNEFLKII